MIQPRARRWKGDKKAPGAERSPAPCLWGGAIRSKPILPYLVVAGLVLPALGLDHAAL